MVNPRPSIALLSVTLIILASSVIFSLISRKPTPTPVPVWHTYTHSTQSFEFKYPSTWTTKTSKDLRNITVKDAQKNTVALIDTAVNFALIGVPAPCTPPGCLIEKVNTNTGSVNVEWRGSSGNAIIDISGAYGIMFNFTAANPQTKGLLTQVLSTFKFLKPNEAISEENINICQTDYDCIYVPYTHCCTSSKAVNRKYLDLYNSRPQWQGVDLESCKDIPCGQTVPFNQIDSESSYCAKNYDGISGNNRCL